jgi:hypothetical protein
VKLPSQDVIKHWLSYDPETGVFRWIREPRPCRPLLGHVAGAVRKSGYVFIKLRGFPLIGAHRLAWCYIHGFYVPELEVDHKDGNPTNNSIGNLRLATSREQKRNKRVQSNNRSGLKGAYYHSCHRGKKWRSQINVGGNLIFLGYFETALAAHLAYADAAREHFGEFARVQ